MGGGGVLPSFAYLRFGEFGMPKGKFVACPRERILNLSQPEPNTGCWLWTGATMENKNGSKYGQIRYRCVRSNAHRFSYVTFIGEIPEGLFVCHRCDTTLCVNPAHLFAATHKDNMKDMVLKGRSYSKKRGWHEQC